MTTDSLETALEGAIRSLGANTFHGLFAAAVRAIIDYDNVISMIWTGPASPVVVYKDYRGSNVFRRLEEDYLSAAFQLDPFYRYHLDGAKPGSYRLLEISPDNFTRSKYYEWYYGDLGISDEITLFCPIGKQMTATVSIGTSTTSNTRFSAKSERRLRQYEGVLLALLSRHFELQVPKTARPSQEAALSTQLKMALEDIHDIKLSNRQAEVAILILQGHSSESVALMLNISPQTVKVFRKQLYKRCKITSQAELFSLLMPLLER